MKCLPVDLPDEPGSILVAGLDTSTECLLVRIEDHINGLEGWSVEYASAPLPGFDYLFLVGYTHPDSLPKYKQVYFFSPDMASGTCHSQQQLSYSDWQATRDIERQLLAMHEAGIWQLPDDVRQRMLDREQMRVEVDREIQESSSS